MNTFELRTQVCATLLEPEQKAFKRAVESLIRRNSEDGGTGAMMYSGIIYKLSTVKKLSGPAPSLQLCFMQEMEDNLKMLRDSKREIQTIWQALLPLVEANGVDNGLPDNLKAILPEKFLPRSFSWESVVVGSGEVVHQNWLAAEKQLAYFISLRMVI